MKSFSPLYYIRENRLRSVLLISMFVLSYIAWLGGLYVTNTSDMFGISMEIFDKCAVIYPFSDEDDWEELDKAEKAAEKEEGVTVMQQGVVSSIMFQTIMAYKTGFFGTSFCSVEDFKEYCRVQGISCDFSRLKAGSVIMGGLAAKNRGMKTGDKLIEEESENIYGSYTLDAVIDSLGYEVYYIDQGKNGTNYSYILLADGMSEQEFAKYTKSMGEEFSIQVINKEYCKDMISRQLNSLNYIYIFIVILLAVVMAVTINAAFVGMYQHREPEFAIYRAIGISKWQIIGKVTGELLLMDIIGILTGGVILFTGVYLFNNLYLLPRGLVLFYYHPLALGGMLFCNLMVLIPLILTRSRQLLRADVCEY